MSYKLYYKNIWDIVFIVFGLRLEQHEAEGKSTFNPDRAAGFLSKKLFSANQDK